EHGRRLQPAELFKHPFSVELMGAGFDKPSNSRYFVLRFPRMLKIHGDRSFKDTVSFEELQEMAKRCMEAPEDSEKEETRWRGKLPVNSVQKRTATHRTASEPPAKRPRGRINQGSQEQ